MKPKEKSYLITYTGKHFYPFAPKAKDVDILDIAHSLSLLCRFNGHTKKFFSVAQHCCNAYDLASNSNKFAALMHDSSEAYLSDVIRPIKPYLTNYYKIEKKLEVVLAKKFRYKYPYEEEVKMVDDMLLHTELRDLFDNRRFDSSLALSFSIDPWDCLRSEKEFLTRFNQGKRYE